MSLRLLTAIVSVIAAGLVGASMLALFLIVVYPPESYGSEVVLRGQRLLARAVIREIRRCCPCAEAPPHE